MSQFVIRRVRTGPHDLRAHLPVAGYTTSKRADIHGHGELFCASLDQPVQYRLSAEFNTDRCPPERLGRDEYGAFLWVTDVVLRANNPGERPHYGMEDFAVDLAYVVDLSLREDPFIDADKIDYVGVVEIDDAHDEIPDRNTQSGDTDAPPPPRPPLVTVDDFRAQVSRMTAALAALAGHQVAGQISEPNHVEPGQEPHEGVPTYSLGSELLRYHTFDPIDGWTWLETTDPDELLYWVVDEIARGLAWTWAKSAPAYAAMGPQHACKTLWLPYWHILMHGLRPDWSKRTRETIRTLAQGFPLHAGAQPG